MSDLPVGSLRIYRSITFSGPTEGIIIKTTERTVQDPLVTPEAAEAGAPFGSLTISATHSQSHFGNGFNCMVSVSAPTLTSPEGIRATALYLRNIIAEELSLTVEFANQQYLGNRVQLPEEGRNGR